MLVPALAAVVIVVLTTRQSLLTQPGFALKLGRELPGIGRAGPGPDRPSSSVLLAGDRLGELHLVHLRATLHPELGRPLVELLLAVPLDIDTTGGRPGWCSGHPWPAGPTGPFLFFCSQWSPTFSKLCFNEASAARWARSSSSYCSWAESRVLA